jgi:nucleotide-binding universal stress UspA family protein
MLKSILVHLTGKPRDEDVLAAASLAAQGFSAHLDCLYVRPDPLAGANFTGDVTFGMSGAIAETIDAVRRAGEEGARNSSETYHSFLRAQDIAALDRPSGEHHTSAAYRDETGDATSSLIEAARGHDVTVLAGSSAQDPVLAADEAGSVLIESGRPVLLVPERYEPRAFRTIAIAWKNRPEAARAVTAAMPLLERADRIAVLAVHEDGPYEHFIRNVDSVVGHLRWHGAKAESRIVAREDLSVPEAVLKTARHAGADVLVMGAYGHSRLRELIFGGFTERVLHGVDIPVLAAH